MLIVTENEMEQVRMVMVKMVALAILVNIFSFRTCHVEEEEDLDLTSVIKTGYSVSIEDQKEGLAVNV